MPTDLSRQYLRAMGIESWQHRQSQPLVENAVDSEPLVSAETAVTLDGSATSETTSAAPTTSALTAPALTAIAACRVGNLDSLLANAMVNVMATDERQGQGSLLLVLERALSDAAAELLTAMLKAINIDRSLLPVATMHHAADVNATSETAESLAAVCERISPAVVVVMAELEDSARLNDLDTHRASLLRFGWLNAQVAVTLHPQVLLDNPNGKRPAWEDLKRVKALLDAN